MKEIQKINPYKTRNYNKNDRKVINSVSWGPMNLGGSSLKRKKIIIKENAIVIHKTIPVIIFDLLLTALGAYFIYIHFLYMQPEKGIHILLFGGMFFCSGLILLKKNPKFTLDKLRNVYFTGAKHDQNKSKSHKQGSLKHIYALQIITEQINHHSTIGGSGKFLSYELNLVLDGGRRINLMDHKGRQDIIKSAQILGDFLNIPIWKRVI